LEIRLSVSKKPGGSESAAICAAKGEGLWVRATGREVPPTAPASTRTARASLEVARMNTGYYEGMGLDERALFTDKPETRQGRYACPKCRRSNDYTIRWVRRLKKDRLPPGADDGDRAKFAKLRDYLLRLDDEVTCKTCGKKFEIPSQQSMVFLDQLAGLPNDDELEREIAAASGEPEPEAGSASPPAERKPPLPARFTNKSSGWK
jgi:hypothetical protein